MRLDLWRAFGSGVCFVIIVAAQASLGETRPVGTTSLRGSCYKLTILGRDVTASCEPWVLNSDLADGRSSFGFATGDKVSVTFSGLGTNEIKLNDDTAIQAIDGIVVDENGKQNSLKAVGKCRFENPYKGAVPISCIADTANGVFEGQFMSDGSTPKVVPEKENK